MTITVKRPGGAVEVPAELATEDIDALQRLADFVLAQVAAEREACAQVAESAALPEHYQWGHDAMEQFDFGKERAAEDIRARSTP